MEVSCLRSPVAHFPFQSFSDVTVVCLEKEETQASTGTHYPFNRANEASTVPLNQQQAA